MRWVWLGVAPAMLVIVATAGVQGCKTKDVATTDESSVISGDSGPAPAPAPEKVDDDGPFDPKTGDEIAALFARVMRSRSTPYKRAVFLKPHGCASATFDIPADLPERYKVGLFATHGQHKAWVRISSDTVPQTSDLENNTIGFAVKVLDVPGKKILAGEEDFTTHDFLMQNIDVFFVDTAKDFLDFTNAVFAGKDAAWLAAHPKTDQILKDMAKPVENVLGSRYWSTTTYRFGDVDYAKYTAKPCAPLAAEPLPADKNNYLRERLDRDVKAKDACFELQVQLRGEENKATMPLDQATVQWSETVSPPRTVAKVTIPKQDVAANDAKCESMSFTAWHALPAHRPVGSVNKARGIVYKKLADERRTKNNVPIAEPLSNAPPQTTGNP